MATEVAFWALAVVGVASALAVVLLRDVFRAALVLILCFLAVAGLYITLSADFLAFVQILIYVGAIAVLLIFGIMVTREMQRGSPHSRLRLPALVMAVALLVTLIFIFVGTDWAIRTTAPTFPEGTTGPLADVLFNEFLLPFEVASVLLLAAVIGAIVVMRERNR